MKTAVGKAPGKDRGKAQGQGAVLKGIRELFVMVVHPADGEGSALAEHLRRIGCHAEGLWPPPARLPPEADMVLVAMQLEYRDQIKKMLSGIRPPGPTVLAVVDYENPTMLQMVLDSGAFAVIGKPIRPFGLLTNLVLARTLWMQRAEAEARVNKAERRLAGLRKIGKAKSILMETRGIGEDEAYASIRDQAMAKRTTMEEIAVAIINAHQLLNMP